MVYGGLKYLFTIYPIFDAYNGHTNNINTDRQTGVVSSAGDCRKCRSVTFVNNPSVGFFTTPLSITRCQEGIIMNHDNPLLYPLGHPGSMRVESAASRGRIAVDKS